MKNLLQTIFSVKNNNMERSKIITILGMKFKYMNKFSKIYSKRFDGLTQDELKFLVSEMFKKSYKYKMDFNNPKTFNEKLNWEKVYYRNPLMHICADKVKAREYFCEKVAGGEKYLVKQYGVYSTVDEINFEELPNEFVLKSNFGSGKQIIVRDKSKINIEETKNELKTWLDKKTNHYYNYFEYGYKDIEPYIVCEEFLNFEHKLEFFCFNGEPKFFWIVLNDKTAHTQANFYELDWTQIPLYNHYPNFEQKIEKPACYEEILENAKKMCGDFPFVRCDFYVTKDSYRFSEMTFFHWAALDKFTPQKYDRIFGDMMKLPIESK